MNRLAWALIVLVSFAGRASAEPAITAKQIEADWLRQNELRPPGAGGITRETDAAGGCDGIRTGRWGFHTNLQPSPWWQIDLGETVSLDRLVLYNRCDGFAARAARILVLASDDAKAFRQIYQHDGKTFYGYSNGKPLVVRLKGAKARYIRLQLPGKDYLHLDEVEVYAASGPSNIALGKRATQSSTSPWSECHATSGTPSRDAIAADIERGLALAEELRQQGVDVAEAVDALRRHQARLPGLPQTADAAKATFLAVHWAIRRMALANPLLDFDTILFVKRAPSLLPHMSDQYYGWWSRPGGGIWLVSGLRQSQPQFRCVTAGWPDGTFLRPELSYDGKRILFAWCRYDARVAELAKLDKEKLPEDVFFHIYEMNLDGSDVRQLTRGRYDDFDARYLPGGEIVFLSTRKGQFLQCGKSSAEATCRATLPDSFVRCGGDEIRPVSVYTLHVMDAAGRNLRAISAFENFEWNPVVAHDGRILYARWDYIDRFNADFESLWSTNPDGTCPQLVYGNTTSRPQCVFEARPIPGSQKLVFVAAAHHSIEGGSLCLLDRRRGNEGLGPIERLTPEVCFPETEGWPSHFFANPYPLSEKFFLVSWSDRPLPPHAVRKLDDARNPPNAQGIYLFDRFGNLELVYRDPAISAMYPIPVRPRPRPAVVAPLVNWDGAQEGRFLLQDVYQGLAGVSRGTVKRLRVIAVPPKPQPRMNEPALGTTREDPGKFVLGSAPVEADGSAYFRVPSGVAVFFQALDERGMALRTMRTLSYVQPNQTLSCVGCHESRSSAPPVGRIPLAALGEPSRLRPGPPGSWPMRFDELVQPVLDRHCTGCHRPDSGNRLAAALDLRPQTSYESLLGFGGGQLRALVAEKAYSEVGDCAARQSRLWTVLGDASHKTVQLDAGSIERLVTWMDVYAQRQGSFSPTQEDQLRQFRRQLAHLLDAP